MKMYNITIPAFILQITAKNEQEALEEFWFCFDAAQGDPEWQNPIISQMKKN